MSNRFLRRLWPLLPEATHRRLALTVIGSIVVAVLDGVGVVLILPLTQLLASTNTSTMPEALDGVASATGIDDPGRLAVLLAVTVVACFVTKGILALLLLRTTLGTALGAEASMVSRLLRGYLTAPLEFHLHRNSADLQRTLHEATRRVYQEALVTAVPAIGDQLILVVVSLVLVIIAPVEALVGGVFMTGLVALYRRLTARRAAASSDALVEESRRSIQYVQQAISAVREVQIAGREQRFADDLLVVRERVATRQRTLTLTELLPRYYLELGVVLGAGLVALTAFLRHPPERATALVALFLAASLRLLPSLNRVMVAENKARVAMPNLDRLIADLDDLEATGVGAADAHPLDPDEPLSLIELAEVEVRYRDQPAPALVGASLIIRPGERVVLVGRSGSGKTTALNVILGFVPPTNGAVLVNGVDLHDRLRSWRGRLAYVPQDVTLLDTSIAENVALGHAPEEIDRDRVREVVAAVGLDGVVAALAGDIDGEIGEGGSRLSGGQRQRLGLARALYQDAEFIVLDEATSALDATTEQQVLDLLDDLPPSVTIIAVAHRRAAISRFPRIALFEDGRIVDDGTPQELRVRRPDLDAVLASLDAPGEG